MVSSSASYAFTAGADRLLVASFVPTCTVTTSASPPVGGITAGDGTYNTGDGVTVTATANPGYAFVNWTEGIAVVSSSASYAFTAGADRLLVANFFPTYTVTTSASPSVGGTTTGDGTYYSGDSVTVQADPDTAYHFVNWTEGDVIVSTSASYQFLLDGNRTLVANFEPKAPILFIHTATAIRHGGQIDVTVIIGNSGDAAALALTLNAKKDATIDSKATHERPPVVLGNIDPGGTATTSLTFSGIKAGTRTLQLILTYTGGTAALSSPVVLP